MLTGEIPGTSIASLPASEVSDATLFEAGRDLALINSVPVDGFGWIKRDGDALRHLQAEHATYRAFSTEHMESDLRLLRQALFSQREIEAVRELVCERPEWLDTDQAWLAHGDFDRTPIFQREGRYAGIIDFGEIRGTDAWYDLGHFHMHENETASAPLLEPLVAGYQSVTPLGSGFQQRIAFASLLIGVRTLARQLQKYPRSSLVRLAAASIRRELASLTR
jgi:Ser/Thr protein kinase RdoA (MazF antagonist)